MKMQRVSYLASSFLAACGGGDGGNGGSDPNTLPPPPPTASANAEGIWDGSALYKCDLGPVRAIITREGKLFFLPPSPGIFIGTVTDHVVDATLYEHGPTPNLAWDAKPGGDALSIGSVVAKSQISATWDRSPDFCQQGQATLHYNDTLYERPSSLAKVAGVYSDSDLTVSANSDGVLTGSDARGCVLNGTVAIAHASRNYYRVTLEVDSCAAAGHYEGVAVLGNSPNGGHDNEVTLSASNADHAIWRTMAK